MSGISWSPKETGREGLCGARGGDMCSELGMKMGSSIQDSAGKIRSKLKDL